MSETSTSQSDLARLSGVHQPSISQFLSGKVGLSDSMLARLLSCMGRSLLVRRSAEPADLDRSHMRSWALHRRLAMSLDETTLIEWTPRILSNIDRLRDSTQGEPHLSNLARWEQLVTTRDTATIRAMFTGLDTGSVEMREVSPFGGLLPESERQAVLRALREARHA